MIQFLLFKSLLRSIKTTLYHDAKINALLGSYFLSKAFLAREYASTPRIAIVEPSAPRGVIVVLNTIIEVMMITTRLMVFPTAWVIGCTESRARNATSL
mmetsp:Transcript_18397/g.24281  ORF Transcript_18397/g.24281 Transcript_18397/m.24281 type:complete len:99 (-) Transcript_18397:983-1279(-)